jgi:Xaa-Pro aminopeptidase
LYATRGKELLGAIKEEHPEREHGLVMLIAGFEHDRSMFWQESSFYYYTGITEPGAVLQLDFSGTSTLYVPNCGSSREQWMHSPIELTQENAKTLGLDKITVLGDQCAGYQFFPFFRPASYRYLLDRLKQLVAAQGTLYTLYPDNEHEYVEQRLVLNRLISLIDGLSHQITDISEIVADARRRKDMYEVAMIGRAIEITELAHEAAAQAIESGVLECEVQASLEYIMTASGSRPAFPSIVATGKNGTILHYMANGAPLRNGDLVVVDIGATYEGYCADLTRTYPVSGTFTKRQRDLYQLVLDTQTYIADLAKPGMYLNNADHPEQSLHHLAQAFLKKRGYDQYFVHGIGHFIGLDVHDVGNVKEPLKEHDVFTIEPGIYISKEGIGIRIEDDYLMVKKGAICLSGQLPKEPAMIEGMVQEALQNHLQNNDDDDDELDA